MTIIMTCFIVSTSHEMESILYMGFGHYIAFIIILYFKFHNYWYNCTSIFDYTVISTLISNRISDQASVCNLAIKY